MPASNHLLRKAAEAGDLAEIERRLAEGDPLEGRHKGTGRTPLLEAVIAGHLDAVRLLVDRGADISAACTALGCTGLGWSAIQREPEIAALLLERGADPNEVPASNALGRSSTLVAAQVRNVDVLRMLLAANGDPLLRDNRGDNALDLAVASRDTQTIDFLRSQGVEPAVKDVPVVLAWPELTWDPTEVAVHGLPAEVTPAQVVRSYILAMHAWEVSSWAASLEARAVGKEPPFDRLLPEAHAIRDAHCTSKKRAFARGSLTGIPNLTPAMGLAAESAPTAARRELVVRRGSDEVVALEYEWRFVCRRVAGVWRIDGASKRVRGTQKWDWAIL